MRVLMLCEQFLPAVGGAEQGAYLLAATLRAQGAEVEVLAVRTDPSWPEDEVFPGDVRVRRVTPTKVDRPFADVRLWGLWRVNTFLRVVQYGAAARRLARGFDVVHAHNICSPGTAFALRAVRRAGLPVIGTAVNTGEWFDLNVLRRTRFGGVSARSALADVELWTAVSDAVFADLRREGVPEDRIVRIPYGVSVPDAPLSLPPVATRFLHVGRLATTAPRDVPGLIEAFEPVVRANGEAELVLLGGGDRLEEIRGLAARSPVAARIEAPGFGDSGTWRRWAHAMAHPSYFEGMSNALLEGMASGLACVAYDIPPNREAFADGAAGILVPVGDRAALARELSMLATVEGAAREWGRRAHERAKSVFDIRRVARQTMDAYERVLELRGAGRRAPQAERERRASGVSA